MRSCIKTASVPASGNEKTKLEPNAETMETNPETMRAG